MKDSKYFKIKPPSPAERILIEKARELMIDRFRKVPDQGVEVEHLGKNFKVFPTVFWPHNDSKPLVENFIIKPGEVVLDLCTGSGVIAIHSALKGAQKVVALDINPEAIKSAQFNAEKFGVSSIVEARISDVYSALKDKEVFDVITCNPPFTNQSSQDFSDRTIKDTGFEVHKKIFGNIKKHLKPEGRMYISQGNFGNIDDMLALVDKNGMDAKLIGTFSSPGDLRIFYAFELNFKNL